MKHLAGWTSAVALAALVAGGVSDNARAGFVSPKVWQPVAARPSHEVLAHRQALTGGIGAAISESELLSMEESWALSIFYQSREFTLVWMSGEAPSAAASDLVRVLAEADTHALPFADYADAVEKISAIGPASPLDDRIAADVALTRASLLYARHASAGRTNPRDLARDITIDPIAADPASTLEKLVAADKPGELLEALNPSSPDYQALRREYLALRKQGEKQTTVVPAGPVMKPGKSDSRVAILRKRLVETGDLEPEDVSHTTEFDDALAGALESFQEKKGLPVDAIVGPMTLAALNHTVGDKLEKLVINMERRRWMPRDLGARHVFVNQPDFRLQVVEDGKVFHTARVIIGKRHHQSPAFSDEIETVVFNPYWNVPDSIAYNEYMPLVRRDPSYMSRQGFQTYVSSGGRFVPMDLAAIDWRHPDAGSVRVKLRQPPGSRNALGRVKFLFPNKHSVYLHDTPSRSLFSRASRALSHGCIRVQDPLKLAEILLQRDGWSREDVDKAVARGTNQHIKLTQKVPVHLAYWTAFADENGQIQYRDDIYGRDDKLAEVLGLDHIALKLAHLADN